MTTEELDLFLSKRTGHEEDGYRYFRYAQEKGSAELLNAVSIDYSSYPPNITLNRRYPIRFHRHERYCHREYHTHKFLEILYLYRGKCIQNIGGETMILQEGELCFVPPGVSHTPEIYDDSILVNLLIEPEEVARLYELIKGYQSNITRLFRAICTDIETECPQYLLISPKHDAYLTTHLRRMLAEYYSDGDMVVLQMFAGTLSLLTYLMQTYETDIYAAPYVPINMEPVLPMMNYVNEHYRTVTLSDLANRFSYTEQHICHLFRRHLGKTYNRYLTELRLGRTKFLLLATNLSFHEIAFHCGYSGDAYFHRMFKKETGMTPIEYRKNAHTQTTVENTTTDG